MWQLSPLPDSINLVVQLNVSPHQEIYLHSPLSQDKRNTQVERMQCNMSSVSRQNPLCISHTLTDLLVYIFLS